MTGTRGSGRWRGDDDGTLGGVKRLKRTVKVVRQAGRSMLRQWRLGLVSRAVERYLRHKCWKFVVGVLGRGVACRVVPVEDKRQSSVTEDENSISHAVVVVNHDLRCGMSLRGNTQRREHVSVRNRRLLELSLMKVRPVAVAMSGAVVETVVPVVFHDEGAGL
jgi:hypothetical protein